MPNELTKILVFLASWQAELAGVVVESTYNRYWLVDGLQAAGLVVHLANTAAIRKYDGLKHSGGETDARYLAHLENITARQHGTRITSNQVKQLDEVAIDQMHLTDDVALAIQANVAVIATLSAQIDIVEKYLLEKVASNPEYALLTTVPGIGHILATIILLEAGTVDRFASAGNFAS